MEVFLVRHAETKLNALGISQNDTAELSEYGLKQAKNFAKRFSAVKIGAIICSKQKRAIQTAKIINKVVKKKILYTELINEMKRPSEVVGMRYDAPKALKIRRMIIQHMNDPSWHYSDEENIADFRARIDSFLRNLSKRRGKSVLIVTHGNVLRMIVGILLLGKDFNPAAFEFLRQSFRTFNTGVTELELGDDGRWRLITWNDYAHLK